MSLSPPLAPPSVPAAPSDFVPILIEPVNHLREKIGGSLHPRYAQTADMAVAALADTLQTGVLSALVALMEARRPLRTALIPPAEAQTLFKHALELKSLGSSGGYPLVTRVAHSLCRLLAVEPEVPLALIDAHIKSVQAIVREDVKSVQDSVAQALALELEQQVAALKK